MNETALAVAPQIEVVKAQIVDPASYLKPIANVAEIMQRQKMLAEIVSQYLIPAKVDKWGNVDMDGADYGLLPGTNTRMLFQPGAEKLALCFGLSVTGYFPEKIVDWDQSFFNYTFKAVASYQGQVIREVYRSCGTNEDKYAFIWVNRQKPTESIVEEMLEEKTGRWGKKWIEENGRKKKISIWQERRPNPNTKALQFVVEAMAQKRGKVAVVKEALAATGYFSTKDIDFDDFVDQVHEQVVVPGTASAGERRGDSGKLRGEAKEDSPAPKTPLGRQALGLKDGLQMSDADFLGLIVAEFNLDASSPVEAVDAITAEQQGKLVDLLKIKLKK